MSVSLSDVLGSRLGQGFEGMIGTDRQRARLCGIQGISSMAGYHFPHMAFRLFSLQQVVLRFVQGSFGISASLQCLSI